MRPAPTSCPVDESFDPLSPEFLADPYAVMAKLPGQSRIFFAPSIGYYVVTRHADVEAVFRDPVSYSAAVTQAPLAPIVPEAQQILLAGGHQPQPTMVSLDEAHARLRKPAARAFSMKRVTAMIPVIEATTARPARRGGRRERNSTWLPCPGLPAPGQHRFLPDGGARTGLMPSSSGGAGTVPR